LNTYKSVLLEDFFALLRQFHREHRNLPSSLASSDFRTSRPTNNLVAEAHTDNADAILLEELLGELDQLQYPRVVIE
jgi:hypothetical protein